jgi:hypothetical protein
MQYPVPEAGMKKYFSVMVLLPNRIVTVQDMPSLNSALHNRASAVEECDATEAK